jgi:outer membrane lipase/esterase
MKSAGTFARIWGAALLGAALLLQTASGAGAQNGFTGIQAFGDSYADTGNLFKILGIPNPAIYPTGRFSGGTNFVDTTSALLGIPQANYAIGGATTGNGITNFGSEWQGFVAAGKTIAPTDVVEISIGGNDARSYYRIPGSASLAGVPAAASISVQNTMLGINALVGVGARNIVFTTGDVSTLPEAAAFAANAPVGSAFSQYYNAQMQVALAAIARSGVRVELVDVNAIGNLIKANPAAYGIANVGACPLGLACLSPQAQNDYLFYLDGIHLTSHGFAILGEYIVNRLNAPLTFAPQGELALNSAMGFASTLFGKLDTFRETAAFVPSAMNAFAQIAKAPFLKAPVAAVNPWSFYMLANGGVSERASTASSAGFNLDSVGGTIGTEYRLSSNAFIGGAFDYSNPKARLFNNAGTTDVNSYQLGVYGAWVNSNFFAQGLATFGWQNYSNSRPGVVSPLSSQTDGTTVVAAGKVGYLFGVGQGQIGPIGGLTYARARLNGYTETGDPVLTLTVGRQLAETLVGSIGAQFRSAFVVNGRIISPYVNLTLEDDFVGNGRNIQFDATSAPLIVNNWSISNASRQPYGRIAGGVLAPISDSVALTMNLSETLGRQGGNDFYGNGGLKISF